MTSVGTQGNDQVARFSIKDVSEKHLCVGCGACAVASDAHAMRRTDTGVMQVELASDDPDAMRQASRVCPFSDDSADEDVIARDLYGHLPKHDRRVGYFDVILAGRVADPSYLDGSSSGGLTSWLCGEMLRTGDIDGVIHVGPGDQDRPELFAFAVSYSPEELLRRRKSQYYSASMDVAVKAIRGDGKRYAFVGVPCYVKAVHNLRRVDPVLNGQIVVTLGLVCGHMKSSAFAELMAWQVGVAPGDLASVDFRKKRADRPSSQYEFEATARNGERHSKRSSTLVGGNWGHATFQLEACDYCDDIFAETADVVFGDAWLPQFERFSGGTNVVVSRNQRATKLLLDAQAAGTLAVEPLPLSALVKSQAGNYRHRWDGLSVRLADDQAAARPSPHKRIAANSRPVDERRRRIVRLRRQMAKQSHGLFLEARVRSDLSWYLNGIRPLAAEMTRLSRPHVFRRAFLKLKSLLRR